MIMCLLLVLCICFDSSHFPATLTCSTSHQLLPCICMWRLILTKCDAAWEWCWTWVGSTPSMKSVIERHSIGWRLNCNSYSGNRVHQYYRPLAIMKISWHCIRIWQVLREGLFGRSDVHTSLHAQKITFDHGHCEHYMKLSHQYLKCVNESTRTTISSGPHIPNKDSIEVWHLINSLTLSRLQSTKPQFHASPTPQHIHSP